VAERRPSGAVADGSGAVVDGSGAATFRSIDQLAELCGHYCWVERRLFEVTGSRASGPATGEPARGDRGAGAAEAGAAEAGAAEVRVVLSQMSARHALFAAQWHDRLPVRADVDAEALIVPPPGRVDEALDLIASAPGLALVLGGLAAQFLPRLRDAYGRHLAESSPVSEAPVRAVLGWAVLSLGQEIRLAGLVVQRLAPDGERARAVENFDGLVQRLLGNTADTFPGARAS
jgi:hypothetical protein